MTTTPHIMPGAEPFFHAGNRVGCLCLHGFTAAPDEVRWLGEYLHKTHGYTVYGPRLAGHGTHYRQLERVVWEDWYLSAMDGYHLLADEYDQIVVAGLSMGGLLGLLISATLPVSALVVMASPLTYRNRLLPYVDYIKYVRRYLPWIDVTDFPRRLREEQLRRGEPNRGRVRYERCPTHAIVQLRDLTLVVQERLSAITVPVCSIYSKADRTVAVSDQQRLAELLSNTTVEQHTLHQSGHILTQDDERETVFEIAGTFIAAHTA